MALLLFFVHPPHLILYTEMCVFSLSLCGLVYAWLCVSFSETLLLLLLLLMRVCCHSLFAQLWCVRVFLHSHIMPDSTFVSLVSNSYSDVFHKAVFSSSSPLIAIKRVANVTLFFGAARWRVCRRQQLPLAVVTCLTVWLNVRVAFWLFACHLTGWRIRGRPNDWLVFRQLDGLIDGLC